MTPADQGIAAAKRDNQLMEEYERIEDLEESARRQCNFKLAKQYQSMLEKIEVQIWPWMAKEEK